MQIFNRQSNQFEFHPGGVFANIVLADEINRASPKTQSALLEVMEEHQVTVDSTPYLVPRPFIVIATQNPIEHEGTYNLPEAQIDRFMMRMSIGYPDPTDEVEIIANDTVGQRIEDIGPVVAAGEVRRMIALTDQIYIAPKLQEYIVQVTGATRAAARAAARRQPPRHAVASHGRRGPTPPPTGATTSPPTTSRSCAALVLPHRMILTPEAELQGYRPIDLLDSILAGVPVPQERVEV